MTYDTALSGHLLEASPEGFTFPNHTPGPRMMNTANDNSHSELQVTTTTGGNSTIAMKQKI